MYDWSEGNNNKILANSLHALLRECSGQIIVASRELRWMWNLRKIRKIQASQWRFNLLLWLECDSILTVPKGAHHVMHKAAASYSSAPMTTLYQSPGICIVPDIEQKQGDIAPATQRGGGGERGRG